jgi:thioredoxin reductase
MYPEKPIYIPGVFAAGDIADYRGPDEQLFPGHSSDAVSVAA